MDDESGESMETMGDAQSPSCDCRQRQTMNHIVDTCPLTKFEGGLNLLHLLASADGEVFDAQCLFQASLGEGEIYPQTYNFLPKWLPNCVLLIFFSAGTMS